MTAAHPISFQHVWKRYQLGSQHDSLRDAIPSLIKRWTGGNGHGLKDGEFWALQDVSFDVEKAETLGIIGHNGAGKSTVLKLLSKISRQTKGDIRLHGLLAALIEVGAGFHPDLTGRENIYLNGTIMGLRHKQLDRLFDSIVAFSELEKFLDMPVKRYSSGMAVRLGFSVAAHINPEILLVDEVLAVGDLAFQQKCYQRILDLKSRGTTIIFISHNLEAVQRLCDRVLLMDRGTLLREGAPSDVILYYRQEVLRKARPTAQGAQGRASVASPDVEFAELSLLGRDGRPRDTFETGDPMRVSVGYTARRTIKQPSVTVTVERMDGLICHEANTQLSGVAWEAWSGRGTLTLDYPELNLLPNTYHVTIAVYEGQNPLPLVKAHHQLDFHVTSHVNMRGAVHLDHRWNAGPPNGGA